MKKIIFTLDNCNEEDVRRIETALRLRENTIDTSDLSERISEMRDFYVQIGFVDHSRNSQ
jgi:hypothetical protein